MEPVTRYPTRPYQPRPRSLAVRRRRIPPTSMLKGIMNVVERWIASGSACCSTSPEEVVTAVVLPVSVSVGVTASSRRALEKPSPTSASMNGAVTLFSNLAA